MTSTRRSWIRTKTLLVAAAVWMAGGSAWAQSGDSSPRPATEADALAIYRARLDAQQANNEANLAAASAGYKQAHSDAREGVLRDQLKMVGNAVKNWKSPRVYSATVALDSLALRDPFAASASVERSTAEVKVAMGQSGLLTWDDQRQLARVATADAALCGGRLKVGDYPALRDGNMLDTPARITQFLATCTDRSSPLVVVIDTGDVVMRQ
jgi:hypothetical protein